MNNTKERPIVLTAQEVNSVLAGNKTQHRVPVLTSEQVATGYKCCYGVASGQVIFTKNESDKSFVDDGYISVECPLGSIGDRLWVQEKHQPVSWRFDDGEVTLLYLDGSKRCLNYLTEEELNTNPNDDYLIEICDELIARGVPIKEDSETFDISSRKDLPHWRSADAMPRWASRFLLEITDIRIERVQNTSHADAVAEGVHHFDIGARLRDQPLSVAQIVFSRHWDTKHQDRDADWESNPWVWVIEFKVIEPSEVTK